MLRERFPTLLRHPHLRPSLVSPIYRQFKNNSLNGYFKRCQNFSFNNLGIDSKVRGELTNLLRKTTKQTIPTKTGTANRPVSGYQYMDSQLLSTRRLGSVRAGSVSSSYSYDWSSPIRGCRQYVTAHCRHIVQVVSLSKVTLAKISCLRYLK